MTNDGLAIVTGASSGIGEEIARQLSAAGRPVLAVGRRTDRLDALAAKSGPAKVHPMALDVTSPGAAASIRDRARELGGAGWLVNNAGTARFGRFAQDDPARHTLEVRLNCEALVALTGAVLPDLVARKSGVILNVASSAGFQPTPFMSVYGATKAFVLSFSEALSEELRGTGVTVTALCSGPVLTEIFASGGAGKREGRGYDITAEECARYAIDAASRGRVVATPGVRNKLLDIVTRFSPRALVRRVSRTKALDYIGIRLEK